MTMEYWEFLIQKEGESSWQPIKSLKLDLEAGRYRVVAHTSRTNIEVEVCVSHQSTGEIPPKRRFQKRSRRTNPEGLMVVIPFTELKPGLWELRCCGDIMSDFLGNSWQHAVQLRVVRTATEQPPQQAAPLLPEKAEPPQLESQPPLLLPPAKTVLAAEAGEAVTPKSAAEPPIPEPSLASATPDNGRVTSPHPVAGATPTHPVWEQSLETLEQILQQVLEPVLQEFNDPESTEAQSSNPSEPEPPVEIEAIASGLELALEEEAFVARHGEALNIKGQVVVDDVEQFRESEIAAAENAPFQGSLYYELRDPQSSQVLLNAQYPLPEEPLPLTFDHTLEIPADCNSRLLLGTMILYSAAEVALSSQSFSVTLDLDELLGAIIPGSKAMPLAKTIAFADQVTNAPDFQEDSPPEAPPTLDRTLLDLVNTSGQKSQPHTWQPSAGQSLPPQIYRPNPTRTTAKSLQLPQFPNFQSTTAVEAVKPAESAEGSKMPPEAIEPQQSESQATASPTETELAQLVEEIEEAIDFSTVKPSEEETDQSIATAEALDSETKLERETVLQEEETTGIVEETTHSSARLESPESLSVDPSQPSDSETATESGEVDSAFQALNLQDRFWSRLNSLAIDTEFLAWLKAEVPPADFEESLQESDRELEVAEFDESMWQEADDVFAVTEDSPPLELPHRSEDAIEQSSWLGVSSEWDAQEIVVDDEELTMAREEAEVEAEVTPEQDTARATETSAIPEGASLLDLESPLPTPNLSVPASELIAGNPIMVRVKLSPHSARLGVKLWLQDRQSRSLLDGPRWLMDLLPNRAGELETLTQLTVPFGSTEIRFEAIAVDVQTQRESQKVAVDCMVLPPDLPRISLDEF